MFTYRIDETFDLGFVRLSFFMQMRKNHVPEL
jgi:hypothetical protein